jgi:hypothetical protein
MIEALYDFYNGILGANFKRSRHLDLASISVPSMELNALEVLFIEDEVWAVIRDLPNNKAPGPDGLTSLFYKIT